MPSDDGSARRNLILSFRQPGATLALRIAMFAATMRRRERRSSVLGGMLRQMPASCMNRTNS